MAALPVELLPIDVQRHLKVTAIAFMVMRQYPVGTQWQSPQGSRVIERWQRFPDIGWHAAVQTNNSRYLQVLRPLDLAFDIKNDQAEVERKAIVAKQDAERTAKEEAARKEKLDMKGFKAGAEAFQKGRAANVLSKTVHTQALGYSSRKALIEWAVQNGYFVETDYKGDRALVSPMIERQGDIPHRIFLTQEALSSIGIEYALYLQRLREDQQK